MVLYELFLLATFAFCESVNGIRVFRNTVPMTDLETLGGAKLLSSDDFHSTDITLCVRFNLQRLGKLTDGRGRIVSIMDWREHLGEPEVHVLFINVLDMMGQFNVQLYLQVFYLGATYPTTFDAIGNPKTKTSFAAYLLKDPDTNRYDVFSPNRWHHFCMSFQKNSSYIRMVKVPMNQSHFKIGICMIVNSLSGWKSHECRFC